MKSKNGLSLVAVNRAAVVCAFYIALTVTPPLSAFSFGAIQLRVSEALSVLPFLFPETAAGVILGCLISNLFSPMILPLDVTLGTLATALAVLATLLLRRWREKKFALWLAPLPTVLFNALIIPVILCCSVPNDAFIATYFTSLFSVGAGEFFAAYVLGTPLLLILKKFSYRF